MNTIKLIKVETIYHFNVLGRIYRYKENKDGTSRFEESSLFDNNFYLLEDKYTEKKLKEFINKLKRKEKIERLK